MAGGKASARQKMINLMYLVFIAMLAMNMSKKVLSSFGSTMNKLIESNIKVTTSNEGIIASLATKANDQPLKYKDKYEKALKLQILSNKYNTYLSEVFSELEKSIEEEEKGNYESYDSDQAVNLLFFKEEGALSEAGQKFLDQMNNYRDESKKIIGEKFSGLFEQINKKFNTSDVEVGKKGVQSYMNAHFEGFPLITTLKDITQIQTDVRSTEADVYNTMLKGALIDDASLSNYIGVVSLDKSAYFSGEMVTGEVVMGKYDKTFTADYSDNVGGKFESGKAVLNFRAGNPGSHDIKGRFFFKGKDGDEDIEVKFDSQYTVITEPSEAVISADKMNVVYRGLPNPISISVPGVGPKNVNATAAGLTNKGGGKYMLKPATGSEVTINVSAKLSSGKTINSQKKFRIMNIPAPLGALRGSQTGKISMPKSSLEKAALSVILPDFVYDLKFKVASFKVKVPGQGTVRVNGGRMNSKAKAAIAKARRGDLIAIFDIESTIIGGGPKVKKAAPINVEIK